MNILIDTIRVAGFRGIKNLEVSLPRITVLIGTNNSGKTSLIKALQLAIGDYARFLSEEDFHIASDDERAKEILVDIRVIPVDDDGNRTSLFNEMWATEFGDKIKAEPNENQFIAIRTRSKQNLIKGGFDTLRSTLEAWPDVGNWQVEKIKETKLSTSLSSLPFISIEAQRDIHQELKEKSSFVGKVLSNIKYNQDDIIVLEQLIKEINDEAVNKSGELQGLKTHLGNLSQSFGESGNVEVTPFPKKTRDLSKHFSIHFGENSANSFSMEYHGMGTRSWASMLTVKSFIDLMEAKHQEESKPFFPILAAEEPEAHLHPNAQKTLYRQLSASKGQLIVSTHSPYLAAMANPAELRALKKDKGQNNVISVRLSTDLDQEDLRCLQREVIHSRGEILFTKALVLCEGETEEQALPMLFRHYFRNESFQLDVNFVGVGGSGKKYRPFLSFSKDLLVPAFIFSDGEDSTVKDLKKHYTHVFGQTDIMSCPNITILDNTDFEGYLISSGYRQIIEEAIKEVDGSDAITNWIEKRDGTLQRRIKTDSPPCSTCNQPIYADDLRDYKSPGGYDNALMDILDSKKPKYAPVIALKLCELGPDKIPPKIIELFQNIRKGAF